MPGLRAHLTGLFPEPPAGSSKLGPRGTALAVVGLLVLGTVLNLVRIGWSASLHTVWAEDGPIYLQGTLTQDFLGAVFEPYAGYLVVGPRLIAEIATAVPLQDAPAAISIVSALVAALSGLAVWVGSGGHIRDPYLRGGLAVATVLAASAGQETLDSAAYAPWFMLAGTFWLLFWQPRTMKAALAGAAFVLLTGLSTPGVWFFMPVALLRALTVQDARAATLLGGFALGAVAQVPVTLGQEQTEPVWSSHLLTAYLQRVLDGGLFGQRLGGNLWAELGWPFLIALSLLLLAGFAFGLRRAGTGARWFAAVAIPTSVAMFLVSAYQRTAAESIFWAAGASGGTFSRYALVPALLLLSAALVTVDCVVRRHPGGRRATLAIAASLAVLLLAVATSFEMSDPERGRPHWDDALRSAANRCVSQGEELAGIATSPAPFGVMVPCKRVASFAGDGVRRPAPPASGAP